MSEKIKAAVARMRQRIATSTAWTISEAKRDEDIRIITDAAEAALPPKPPTPRDHVVICFSRKTGKVALFDCDGHLMTEETAIDRATKWGAQFRETTYTVSRLNTPAVDTPDQAAPATLARFCDCGKLGT